MTCEDIIQKLMEMQYQSNNPENFELAIEEAFNFLGFESRHIGGSGDTDVLAEAKIGCDSYKLIIDGKTRAKPSENSRPSDESITNSRINWMALRKHKEINEANNVIVIGPNFPNSGDAIDNANQIGAILFKTEQLVELVRAHSSYPLTLKELKVFFVGNNGLIDPQLEEIIGNSIRKRDLIKKLKIIINIMEILQSRREFFTIEGLACRDEIFNNEIEDEDINIAINLFSLPFINIIEKLRGNSDKYIITTKLNDISNIFQQISNIFSETKTKSVETIEELPSSAEILRAYKFFECFIREQSIVMKARPENPYKWACPLQDFKALLNVILDYLRNNSIVSVDKIASILEGKEYLPSKIFTQRSEVYKIKMALGLLELKTLIKWNESTRPIEFILNISINDFEEWINRFPNDINII